MVDRNNPQQGTQQFPQSINQEEIQSNKQDAELVRWQMDTTDIYEEIKHKLRGEVLIYDSDTEKYFYKKVNKQIINDEAIDDLLGSISFMNRNVIMSDLDMREIDYMIEDARLDIARNFLLKADTYNITMNDATLIVDGVVNFVYAMLKRAHKAGERNTMRFTTRSNTMQTMQSQRKKLFGIL